MANNWYLREFTERQPENKKAFDILAIAHGDWKKPQTSGPAAGFARVNAGWKTDYFKNPATWP